MTQTESAQSWTPQDIIVALRSLGWSNQLLAAEVSLKPSSIPYALRTGSSRSLRALVHSVTGVHPALIWPGRFPPQWRVLGSIEGEDLVSCGGTMLNP